MTLTSEEQDVLSETDRFARGELYPLAADMDNNETWPEGLFERLGAAGYFSVAIPEEYGGAGASRRSRSELSLGTREEVLRQHGRGPFIVVALCPGGTPILATRRVDRVSLRPSRQRELSWPRNSLGLDAAFSAINGDRRIIAV